MNQADKSYEGIAARRKGIASFTPKRLIWMMMIGAFITICLFILPSKKERMERRHMWEMLENYNFASTRMRVVFNVPEKQFTPEHKKTFSEFQKYGKSGTDFLIPHARDLTRLYSTRTKMLKWFAKVTNRTNVFNVYRLIGAKEILSNIEKPLEWIEPSLIWNDSDAEVTLFSIDLLHGVTNRLDEVTALTVPFLSNKLGAVRSECLTLLSELPAHQLLEEKDSILHNKPLLVEFPQYLDVLSKIAPNSIQAVEVIKELAFFGHWQQRIHASMI